MILLRLFLFVGGSGMLYSVYLKILDPTIPQGEKIISAIILSLLGLGSIIYAIWYKKVNAWETEEEVKDTIRWQNRRRELSPDTKVRRAKFTEFGYYLFCFAVSMLMAYVVANADPKKESQSQLEYALGLIVCAGISIYLFIMSLSPIIKIFAKRRGWKKIYGELEMESDIETQALREREERMATFVSDGTLLLATQSGDIRNALEEYVSSCMSNYVDGTAQLWQLDQIHFAITFPCGVSRIQLMEMMYILWSECNSVTLWLPSKVTKRTTGEWTMVIMNDNEDLVAASDDGRQWITSEADDELLFKSSKTDLVTFQPRPNINFESTKKRGLYY